MKIRLFQQNRPISACREGSNRLILLKKVGFPNCRNIFDQRSEAVDGFSKAHRLAVRGRCASDGGQRTGPTCDITE